MSLFKDVIKFIFEFDIFLDWDVFLWILIRKLLGILEKIVGLEEVLGFISIVG